MKLFKTEELNTLISQLESKKRNWDEKIDSQLPTAPSIWGVLDRTQYIGRKRSNSEAFDREKKHEKIDSWLPTAPSIRGVLDRRLYIGRKRSNSEAFDREKKEMGTKCKCLKQPEFEIDKPHQSTVECSDLRRQGCFKENTSSRDTAQGYIGDIFSLGKRIRFNLPKFTLPVPLSKKDEKAMGDLHLLLRDLGFEVHDRPTLAFFAIGAQHEVVDAAQYFKEFYNFARTWEMRFPDRSLVDQITNHGPVEGVACHNDGTFGCVIGYERWKGDNHDAKYMAREIFCHYLNIIDLPLLRKGNTVVANMRNLSWRKFMPIELSKMSSYLKRCLPFGKKTFLFVEPNFYASVAFNLVSVMASLTGNNIHVLSLEQTRNLFPDVILPPSLTPIRQCGDRLTKLSVDEQINFRILID